MKKKNRNITLKEYRKKFKPLHNEILKKVQDVIDETLPKHLDRCPGCDENEFALAENVISKSLCGLSARFMIASRTMTREPVDFATTVELKKNFETVLQNNINNYNDWYQDDVLNKDKSLH